MSNSNDKTFKLKNRSKKYTSNFLKIKEALAGKSSLDLEIACQLLFDLEQPNYKDGASVETHFRLSIDPTKTDQLVRSSCVLPHGSGKKIKVAAFVNPEKEDATKTAGAEFVGGEELIEKIKKEGKINFDRAVAEPNMMRKLPSIARILGVAGAMPNPKNNTVGENIATLVKNLLGGKVDFKNDKNANVHVLCGKVNSKFSAKKIQENIEVIKKAILDAKPEAVKKNYLQSMYICHTLSPSIRII